MADYARRECPIGPVQRQGMNTEKAMEIQMLAVHLSRYILNVLYNPEDVHKVEKLAELCNLPRIPDEVEREKSGSLLYGVVVGVVRSVLDAIKEKISTAMIKVDGLKGAPRKTLFTRRRRPSRDNRFYDYAKPDEEKLTSNVRGTEYPLNAIALVKGVVEKVCMVLMTVQAEAACFSFPPEQNYYDVLFALRLVGAMDYDREVERVFPVIRGRGVDFITPPLPPPPPPRLDVRNKKRRR